MKDDSPTPLSDRERRVLAEMELALRRESPDLATWLRAHEQRDRRRHRVVGSAVVAVGVALLVVGLLTGFVAVGLIGFVVVLGGLHTLTTEVSADGILDAIRRTFGPARR